MWCGMKFVSGYVPDCDYIIVLNGLNESMEVRCNPNNIWAIIQEPPIMWRRKLHDGNSAFSRIYTTCPDCVSDKHYLTQAALPWHVNKTFDELINMSVPEKIADISCIISKQNILPGHRDRLNFISNIRNKIDFDIFGRGVNEINDKWDGLAPYKYSFAIENYSNSYYWTEKISDCYLSYTMPIYYGCKNIEQYFPPESIIKIDINNDDSVEIINEAISNNLWKKNIEAISYARELVLNKYNIFPFVEKEIKKSEDRDRIQSQRKINIVIPSVDPENKIKKSYPLSSRFKKTLNFVHKKCKYLIGW